MQQLTENNRAIIQNVIDSVNRLNQSIINAIEAGQMVSLHTTLKNVGGISCGILDYKVRK